MTIAFFAAVSFHDGSGSPEADAAGEHTRAASAMATTRSLSKLDIRDLIRRRVRARCKRAAERRVVELPVQTYIGRMNPMNRWISAASVLVAAAAPAGAADKPVQGGLDTAAIEQLTGAKGALDAKEGVFKVSLPRADIAATVGGARMTQPYDE